MIVSGIFIGINNTLVTQAVMMVSPVERPVASATYGFVRFIGGGIAPYAAGRLAERFTDSVPFWVGAGGDADRAGDLQHRPPDDRRRGRADGRRRGRSPTAAPSERELEGAEGLESFGGGETAEDSWEPARS